MSVYSFIVYRSYHINKTWLITGSASGRGRNIAEAALAAGHNVLATARNPAALNDLVAKYGERVRAFKHDVVEEQDGIAAVRVAVETFGRLDVAVNNDWGHRASQNRPAIHSDYEPSVSAVMPALEGLCGNETIDPDRVAQVV